MLARSILNFGEGHPALKLAPNLWRRGKLMPIAQPACLTNFVQAPGNGGRTLAKHLRDAFQGHLQNAVVIGDLERFGEVRAFGKTVGRSSFPHAHRSIPRAGVVRWRSCTTKELCEISWTAG